MNEAGDWDCQIVKEIIDDDEVALLMETNVSSGAGRLEKVYH